MISLSPYISTILSPDYVNASVAILAGLFVFMLYSKQKFDNKKDAANTILLEIQHAERQITQVKESLARNPIMLPDIFIIPHESWSRYSYLFFTDFVRNEWDEISNFYNNSKLYDRAVEYNNSFFQKNEQEIRINIQRVVSSYVKDYKEKIRNARNQATKAKLKEEMNNLINEFISEYLSQASTNPNVYYAPSKPLEDAKIYIENIDNNISLLSIGSKLEKMRAQKFLIFFK